MKLSVSEAAKRLGVSRNFIVKGLQQGRFSWGYAVKMSGTRWEYFISKERFEEEERC